MNANPHIALVDDEPSVRRALRRLLHAHGFAVEDYESAAAFLASLSRQRPHCVLLDLHMPGMSGFEVLEALQSMPASPPVIVVTADCTRPIITRAMALGARQCVSKPVYESILIDAVNASLRP